METRKAAGVIAGTAALVTAIVAAFLWDPDESYPAAPNTAADTIAEAELTTATHQRVFLGHRSVGENILSGVEGVYAAKGMASPALVEISLDEGRPEPPYGGVLAHAAIGRNRHPEEKLANYDHLIRGGLADAIDVALLKFCYEDVTWRTDVDALFAAYTSTLEKLERDHPDVTFLHVTVPLTTGPNGLKDHLKILIGRDDNAARARYNALLRKAYDPSQVFDLAAVEATAPDGSRGNELQRGLSSDGAHLNDTGSALAAVELLRLLTKHAEN